MDQQLSLQECKGSRVLLRSVLRGKCTFPPVSEALSPFAVLELGYSFMVFFFIFYTRAEFRDLDQTAKLFRTRYCASVNPGTFTPQPCICGAYTQSGPPCKVPLGSSGCSDRGFSTNGNHQAKAVRRSPLAVL